MPVLSSPQSEYRYYGEGPGRHAGDSTGRPRTCAVPPRSMEVQGQ